jgi:hypothetical protein
MTYDEAGALAGRFLSVDYPNVTAQMVLDRPRLWSIGLLEQAEAIARHEQEHAEWTKSQYSMLDSLIGRLSERCSERSESLAIVDAAVGRLSA